MTTHKAFSSDAAPPPAGTFSIAVQAAGLVFLAGQTPRDLHNVRHGDKPFAEQVRMTLDNLSAAAEAAGSSLAHAVKVQVFLTDTSQAPIFDAVYKQYVGHPPPARTLVQSSLMGFDVEVDAVLAMPVAGVAPLS